MSEMNLEVAVRSLQNGKTVLDIYNKIKTIPKFKIDESESFHRTYEVIDTIYRFIFKSEELDLKMRVSEIDKQVFFDFILSKGEAYEVNESFTAKDFELYEQILKDLNLNSEDLTFRVFYYYNGGCAGLEECI